MLRIHSSNSKSIVLAGVPVRVRLGAPLLSRHLQSVLRPRVSGFRLSGPGQWRGFDQVGLVEDFFDGADVALVTLVARHRLSGLQGRGRLVAAPANGHAGLNEPVGHESVIGGGHGSRPFLFRMGAG